MKRCRNSKSVITGLGITSAVGQGVEAFSNALWNGNHSFAVLKREDRCYEDVKFIGAEIPELSGMDAFSRRVLRKCSYTEQVALATVKEAWEDAELQGVNPDSTGLIIGGSNVQQRELLKISKKYRDDAYYIPATYACSYMDTDICGLCTEEFGIHGLAYTVGGASASGQLAFLQAVQAVESGMVDVCIAVGTLMDLSYLECQAFRSIGAMGSDRYSQTPDQACRPFDNDRDGFIYGENCAVLVVESKESAKRRGKKAYATVEGFGIHMDANRNPNPSLEGEMRAIQKALEDAELESSQIDYINPHGSGSKIGDQIELEALKSCGLNHAYINATKSITGHGLSAAGAVELVATVLQMKEGKLHPTRNLLNPIDTSFHWVQESALDYTIQNAISMSIGFGGINTAVCLSAICK
ncbi:MAG TPA: polyketide beta-ketoacyl:ACP synthase [Lachnospiraceae bacterium]|nr:beta-ketoacyl synthase N-terminal-like domain-containing protein [uncultured Lachnoclostridium sp.]HAU86142.1 polyketide beta-ketoacyl:ACP synthase [Lachnospiraceae bacterium]